MRARSKNYRWVVFFVLAAGYFMVYFHRLCPAVVALDLMRDFHADGALIGLLASAYFYPYALMQLPSGLLSDSWGPRRTVTVFFLLAGVASMVMGEVHSVGAAIAARVAVGVGVAMFFVPAMKMLTMWFSVTEFTPMAGLLMAMGGLGALGAAAPLAFVSEIIGWRGSFEAVGVLTLVVAGAVWLFVRDDPREVGLPPANPLAPDGDAAKAALKGAGAARIPLWRGVGLVLKNPRFWPLAFWFFCTNGVFFTFGGLWGGPYLMHAHGLSKAQAGNVLSMLAVALIFGSPLVSRISNSWLKSRKRTMIATSILFACLNGALALWPGRFSLPMLYVWSVLFGFASGAAVVVGFTALKELFPLELSGTALGAGNFFPFAGAAFLQPVTGIILERWPHGEAGYPVEAYGAAFLAYFAASVLAVLCAFGVKETFGAQEKGAAGTVSGPPRGA